MNWRTNVEDFQTHQDLMATDWAPIQERLTACGPQQRDFVEETCTVWMALALAAKGIAARNPRSVLLIRNEDVAHDPLGQFQRLFAHCDLRWSPRDAQRVEAHTAAGNPVDAGSSVHQIARDSRRTAALWKSTLDESVQLKIRKLTADVASEFYEDSTW